MNIFLSLNFFQTTRKRFVIVFTVLTPTTSRPREARSVATKTSTSLFLNLFSASSLCIQRKQTNIVL